VFIVFPLFSHRVTEFFDCFSHSLCGSERLQYVTETAH